VPNKLPIAGFRLPPRCSSDYRLSNVANKRQFAHTVRSVTIDRQAGSQTERQTDFNSQTQQTYRQAGRQGIQAGRHSGRQTDRQINRQKGR
jgi:hypothetical protein